MCTKYCKFQGGLSTPCPVGSSNSEKKPLQHSVNERPLDLNRNYTYIVMKPVPMLTQYTMSPPVPVELCSLIVAVQILAILETGT